MNLKRLSVLQAVLLSAISMGTSVYVHAEDPVKISRPGQYSSYSSAIYDGFKMSSVYMTVRDGTKIAIDILRPTKNGELSDDKLPVVWMHSPYNRRLTDDGRPTCEYYPGMAEALVKYGYIVAVTDMRGNFASGGKAIEQTNRNEWMPWGYWDAYDITEWLAGQSWSNGKIGMWGCSATGMAQWQAAVTAPPHLRAIFPNSAPSEYYPWGGIAATTEVPAGSLARNPSQHFELAVPVDEDKDGSLAKALARANFESINPGVLPFRDSISTVIEDKLGWKNFRYFLAANTLMHFDEIRKSKIPIYESANFGEDQRVKLGVMIKLRNLDNPMKLVVAPGRHCNWSSPFATNPSNPFDITQEEHRWFDYWLKGIQNGIMDEPPIWYYTYNLAQDRSWKYAWQWPLPSEKRISYFLTESSNQPVKSGVNNGGLETHQPVAKQAQDLYTVDYKVTPANQNEKGMTFTTDSLPSDTTMIGHPVVHLWISSTATDGDFLAFLADIGPDGTVTPLPGTEDGRLRASHRVLNQPSYDNLGLPYHRSFQEDAKPLVPGSPTELTFDMAPISWNFKAGHRIRLIISCTAVPRPTEAQLTPVISPAPVVTFYRDAAHPSRIELPESAPVQASVIFSHEDGKLVARMIFPASLDKRYIADVQTNSVELNQRHAKTVRIDNFQLVASWDEEDFTAESTGVVKGKFGNKFDYGDFTTFEAKGSFARSAKSRK